MVNRDINTLAELRRNFCAALLVIGVLTAASFLLMACI